MPRLESLRAASMFLIFLFRVLSKSGSVCGLYIMFVFGLLLSGAFRAQTPSAYPPSIARTISVRRIARTRTRFCAFLETNVSERSCRASQNLKSGFVEPELHKQKKGALQIP